MTPLKPHFGGGVIDGGRLSGFGGDLNGPPPPPDNRMFKIGLGVFGAIALILGSMLSVFYIQKKKKDEQLKRRKHRQTKSPQYPPQPPQYPQMGFPDPQMAQYQQQMPFPAQFQPQYAYQPQFDQFQNYSPAEQDQVLSSFQLVLTSVGDVRLATFGVNFNTHLELFYFTESLSKKATKASPFKLFWILRNLAPFLSKVHCLTNQRA